MNRSCLTTHLENPTIKEEHKMKRVFHINSIALAIILGCAAALAAQDYAPDQVIVKGATPAQLASLGGDGVKAATPPGRGGDQLITLKRGMSVKAAVALLEKLPNVEYACPNYIRKAADTIPTDPDYGYQWAWPKIEAPLAWDDTTGSATVHVGVIDTGVDLDHEDLLANLWVNQLELAGSPGVDDDGNGYFDDIYGWNGITDSPNPDDDDWITPGHGTHSAGIIGAASNTFGGVGANWNVKIMPLKFLNALGSGYDIDAIDCIDYVIATNNAGSSNVRILSNSWSGAGGSPALQAAIERARDAGIVFVAAAGNESYNIDSPGCVIAPGGLNVLNIVTVVASDQLDNMANFSNYGRSLCALRAPGVTIYSTVKDNKYKYLNGTSMATPHVAGVFALVLAIAPGLEPVPGNQTSLMNFIDRVLLNVDPVVADPVNEAKTSTGARLNANRAVKNQPNGAYNPDVDGDFIPNHWDNCPFVYNFGQADSNLDGVGEACEPLNIPCPGFGCPVSAAP
jgi:subtilisin family serine protease